MPKKKGKTVTVRRDARTGRFTTRKKVKKNPSTTVTERRKKC